MDFSKFILELGLMLYSFGVIEADSCSFHLLMYAIVEHKTRRGARVYI